MTKSFALIDANNFYASCERVFNPALLKLPVVVLSSNDGCVIARSNEAKSIGIKMGEPFFKISHFTKTHKLRAISSNFALYGDMSRRMMTILEEFSPICEVYSIDECFLDFSHLVSSQIKEKCAFIRNRIKKWLGLTVSIGVGGTKTLAKLANHLAKTRTDGIYHFSCEDMRMNALKATEVSDIWGIGPRYSKKLKTHGITKAIDLVNAADSFIRKQTNILGLKTAYELRGTSCLEITEEIPPKQSITVSRSFGNDVRDYDTLSQALCYFATNAAEKLRKSAQVAKSFSIFIRTNPFAANSKQYSNAATISFTYPTDATPTLLAGVTRALQKIYRKEYVYKKAGIILTDLSAKTNTPYDLFDRPLLRAKSSKLMHAIDKINLNYGRGTIFYASQGIKQTWLPKSNMRSGLYTSNWHDIIRAS